jgi:methylated-DNA-[protein]-cysteine S-methyltransferase
MKTFLSPRPAWIAQARAETPLGPVTMVATERGLAGLWFDGQKHHPGPIDVPLDPQGSDFQRAVWAALRDIAAGRTTSYGALARQLGREARAARAIGAAVGRNPLSVIVPCHRVLGGDGALTGYAGGLDRKRALLKLEGAGA